MNNFIRDTKDFVKKSSGRYYEPWIRLPLLALRSFIRDTKAFVKKISGRNYEYWIRRPLIALRSLKRKIIMRPQSIPRAVMQRLDRAGKCPQLLLGEVWMRLQRRTAENVRSLQLRIHVYLGKPRWHPLRLLVCPILEMVVRVLERRYRRYFLRFGEVVTTLRHTVTDRYSLLLMSGTLGPGGSERQTVLTLMGLTRRGLRSVSLAVCYLRTEYERFYQHKLETTGMPFTEFNRDTSKDDSEDLREMLRAVSRLPAELHDVADYARTLAVQCPQLVHLWLDEVNIKGGLAAVAAGVPRIVISGRNLPPNNFYLYQPYMREGYRWLLRQPGVTLINNSAAGARAYERWLGFPKGSIRVVHNGFDFDERLLAACREGRAEYRERHGIPLKAPMVGTVIRLSEEKRPLLWAEIAARIGRVIPEAHFLVVGDGPLRAELEARAACPDLAGRLHIIGLEKQPLAAMAAMDLFLLSSRGEGLPNVLIEAQSLGVPVVTTRVGGAPETLEHKRTGWVLKNASPVVAAAVITRLLADKQWLAQAGLAGRDFVHSRFGLERMLDETLEIYGAGTQRTAIEGNPVLSERAAS